mmetsp:Transcript_20780/g.66138  ORF Transcript_20780/g.66138 Transcript_20780/m.66138 type:complete len:249 (+) Transcript_20780:712-1458(+)
MRHIELSGLEGVGLGVGRDVEVSRHAVDEHHSLDKTALANPAHLRLSRANCFLMVVIVHVILDEALERLVRTVADVRLVRDGGMVAVHTHRREGVNMLLAAEVSAGAGAVRLGHQHVAGKRLLHHVGVRLFPHGLKPPRPRAPRRVIVDQNELPRARRVAHAVDVELRRHLGHRHAQVDAPRDRVLHRPWSRRCSAQHAAVRVEPGLDDVCRYVLQVCAHHVGDVYRGEATGQVVQRHVEVDLDLLLL